LKTVVYKHYKGKEYMILLDNAFIEKNLERAVVYKSIDDGKVWIRPYDEFFGEVEINGKKIPRFQKRLKEDTLQEYYSRKTSLEK